MPDLCDVINGPCACGAWHKMGDGTFGQKGMWPNGKPNGGQDATVLVRGEACLFYDPNPTLELPVLTDVVQA